MVLIAAGPGAYNLKDYTNYVDAATIEVHEAQGDTLDTLKAVIHDRTNSLPIANEADVVLLDETDPNGFPTLNLLLEPSFEAWTGAYSGGIAHSWAGINTGVAGFTVAADSASGHWTTGGTSEKMTWANVANATTSYIYQNVTLPVDDTGAAMVDLPFSFSVYSQQSGLTNVQPFLAIAWTAGGSTLRVDQVNIPVRDSPTLNSQWGWRRHVVRALPPSNATGAQVLLGGNTTSATNSGSIWFDAAQFERETFALYRSGTFPQPGNATQTPFTANGNYVYTNPPLVNAGFDFAYVSGLAPGWASSGSPAGLTVAADTTTVHTSGVIQSLPAASQSITLANVANSTTWTIGQYVTLPRDTSGNPLVALPYAFNLFVNWGNPAPSGASFALKIDWYTSALALISTSSQALTPVSSTSWFQPSVSATPPTNAASAFVYFSLTTTSGTNSGTIRLDDAALAYSLPSAYPTATQALVYPTKYCDVNQWGCYTDAGYSGCNYRHLRLFAGYARNVAYDLSHGFERDIVVDATDYTVLAQEAPATLVLAAQADNLAISQAVQYAQNQGFLVGVDYTSFVSNIANTDQMVFNWQTFRSVMNKIADQTVAAWYIDYYRRLHYVPALSDLAPIALSYQPDGVTTFPFSKFRIEGNTADYVTDPVFQGSTQLSGQQTSNRSGSQTTTTATYTQAVSYTSLAVNALTVGVLAGDVLQIGVDAVTVAATASATATTIAINAWTPSQTYASGTTVALQGILIYANGVAQIDSCTVGGVGQDVGLNGVNNYASGYDALLDTSAGILYFHVPPATSVAIVTVYRFDAPVMVRVHAPTKTGRRVFTFASDSAVTAQRAAIDRANADLTINGKVKAIGHATIVSPPVPTGISLRSGQAIRLTHPGAGLSNALYQIQGLRLRVGGNGTIIRELDLGFYRPDYIIQLRQAQVDVLNLGNAADQAQVITDQYSFSDGWTLDDSAGNFTLNVGNVSNWGPDAHAGTWSGTSDWG